MTPDGERGGGWVNPDWERKPTQNPRKRQALNELSKDREVEVKQFDRKDACELFWKRLEDLRPQCLEDLRSHTDHYRELVRHSDPEKLVDVPGSASDFLRIWPRLEFKEPPFDIPESAWNLLHAWARSWNLLCTRDWDSYWPEYFARLHLEAPERAHLPWRHAPARDPGKLSSLAPEEAARARRNRQTRFWPAAIDLFEKALPGGFKTEAEVAAARKTVKWFIGILADAGARLDAPNPSPWSRLLKFEDGWDPSEMVSSVDEEGKPVLAPESSTTAKERIEKRFKRDLDDYLNQITAGVFWESEAKEQDDAGRLFMSGANVEIDGYFRRRFTGLFSEDYDPKVARFRADAFDWLVMRVVPAKKGEQPLAPTAIRKQIASSDGDVGPPSRTVISKTTKALAEFLGLELP